MITASAPRGTTPPVAIVVAVSGPTSSAGGCPPPRPTPLRGIAPAAPRGGSRRSDPARPISVRRVRSWPASYHDLGAGRISLAVGRHQDPAVGLRQRRQRHIARGYGLRHPV